MPSHTNVRAFAAQLAQYPSLLCKRIWLRLCLGFEHVARDGAPQHAPQTDVINLMYVVGVKISSVTLLHRASLILLKGCAQSSYYV